MITLSSYKERESLWKPCLVDDFLGLAFVISKHGNAVQNMTGVSRKDSLTESLIVWSCLGKYLNDSTKTFHTLKNKYVRDFIQKTVHVGRVIRLNRVFLSSSFD